MKFKVHLFREYREAYEVEAENADAAIKYVDKNIRGLDPVQSEMQDYLPYCLVDPILPDGTVDYDNSVWRE